MMEKPKLFIWDMLLSLLILFPVLFSPTSKLAGSDKVDVWNHAWGPWWWGHSISEGQIPWETSLLHYPDGGTLWFIDPILALIGAPLAIIHPALGYNFVLWLYVAFASWAARRFARSLGAAPSAAWIASIAFALSGWMLSEINNGITEAVNIGPVALALAWTEDAVRANQQQYKKWAKAGLGIGLATIASPYLGLGAGIAATVRGLHKFWYAWIGAVVAGIIAAPPMLALRTQIEASNAIIKRPEGMNISLALHNAVDPRTFVMPFGFQSVDLSNEGFVHTMYLGIITVPLAATVWKEHKGWICAGLTCIIFSLGPYLYWGDGWLIVSGSRFRMPWFFLQQFAEGLAVTHPLRLAVPSLAIVAAMAAKAATTPYWLDRLKRLYIVIALDGLILCGAPWPIKTANATFPKAYEVIKADKRKVGVLDLPTDAGATMGTSRYLYWQAAHNKGIPYAPDARASTSSLLNNPAFRRLAALCKRRTDEHQRLGLNNSAPGNQHPQSLMTEGIGWIVLHEEIDPIVSQQLREVIQADLGAGVTIEGATVWRIESKGE
jgi:hypothetical protein